MKNDVELLYDEYLDALGISKKDTIEVFRNYAYENTYVGNPNDYEIFDAIFDRESSVIIHTDSGLYDKYYSETDLHLKVY